MIILNGLILNLKASDLIFDALYLYVSYVVKTFKSFKFGLAFFDISFIRLISLLFVRFRVMSNINRYYSI